METVADDDRRRMDGIVRATCLCLLASLAMGRGLYIRVDRIFAITPLIPALRHMPVWTDLPALYAVLAALAWQMIRVRARWPIRVILAVNLYWVCQDLERIQPYVYLYCFVLLVALAGRPTASSVFPALRLTISSFYVWAGLQKLNMTFVGVIFPWFVGTIAGRDPGPVTAALVTIGGIGVPLFEIAIGIFMLIPRLRTAGLAMACLVLAVALTCLGPLGRNYNAIVWPLNIYVVFLDFLLFYGFHEPGIGRTIRVDPKLLAALVLFTLGPLFSGSGISPLFASLKLYSGNIASAYARPSADDDLAHAPMWLATLLHQRGELSLHDWTMHEFSSIVFPDQAVFRTGARGLCPFLSDPDGATLRIYDVPDRWTGTRRFVDYPLCDGPEICLPDTR